VPFAFSPTVKDPPVIDNSPSSNASVLTLPFKLNCGLYVKSPNSALGKLPPKNIPS
jgi:hypothetical protein